MHHFAEPGPAHLAEHLPYDGIAWKTDPSMATIVSLSTGAKKKPKPIQKKNPRDELEKKNRKTRGRMMLKRNLNTGTVKIGIRR